MKGIRYFYLVEGCRVDGKVRQRVVCYLGEHKTVKAALEHWRELAKAGKDVAERKHAREMVAKLKPYL